MIAYPPVRRAVPVFVSFGRRAQPGTLTEYFGGRCINAFRSGTEALTVALRECLAVSRNQSDKIILPAYGCPDLVSACVGAGGKARLVDVASTGWGYDLSSLQRALSDGAAAVVAVNLLGIGDDAGEVARLAKMHGALTVQDWAQCFPRDPQDWCGDYVVFSFGRGKPLNLLGGGLLVGDVRGHYESEGSRFFERMLSALKALAFNVVTDRRWFDSFCRLTKYRIGDTAYRPPVEPLKSSYKLSQLAAVLPPYRQYRSYDVNLYAELFSAWRQRGIEVMSVREGGTKLMEPLRLPLIASSRELRNTLVEALNQHGFGASRMYGASLSSLPGVPMEVKEQGSFINAEKLADMLFTLPTHSQVSRNTVMKMSALVERYLEKAP